MDKVSKEKESVEGALGIEGELVGCFVVRVFEGMVDALFEEELEDRKGI